MWAHEVCASDLAAEREALLQQHGYKPMLGYKLMSGELSGNNRTGVHPDDYQWPARVHADCMADC